MAEPYLWSYSRHSPQFMELEGSLQHSKQPATCPSLKPDQSNPRPLLLFIKNHYNINLHQPYLFPSGYSIKIQYPFIPPVTPPITRTVFGSTTQHDAPHYATFSILRQHQFLVHWPSLNATDQVSHPYKQQENLPFCL